MRSVAFLCVAFSALVALACGGAATGPDASKPAKSPDELAGFTGRRFAKEVISPMLASPATADFPSEEVISSRLESLVDSHADTTERWSVRGVVDAKNPFGVPIRHQWEVVVLFSNDNFTPGQVSLDGSVVFESNKYLGLLNEHKSRKDAAAAEDREWRRKDADQSARERQRASERLQAEEAAKRRPAEDEAAARAILSLANQLSKAGKKEKAIEHLKKIIEKYPHTETAGEAREILKKLQG